LHALFDQCDPAARVGQRRSRHTARFCRSQLRTRVRARGDRVGQCALRVLAGGGHSTGGVARGVLRAFARVEGVVEGETVVALRHCVVRPSERALRGSEFLGGEPIGAGRARGLDRGLGLLEFLVGRRTAGASHQRAERDR
jgi:hypothetical protein